MRAKALGIIEAIGLTAAIEAADAAAKAANVTVLGYENAKGGGRITVKLVGDVGAVKAAISAGSAAALRVGKLAGCLVIPRPHDEIAALIAQIDRGRTLRTGTASTNGAPLVEAEGSVVETEGSVVEAEGSVVEAEGSVVETEGSVVETEGSVVEAEGSIVEAEGSIVEAEGSVVETEGSVVEAEGSVVPGATSDSAIDPPASPITLATEAFRTVVKRGRGRKNELPPTQNPGEVEG